MRSQGMRRRRMEEPGRRQEGLRAGGAKQDPGYSHDGDPRWRLRREEPWWRKGRSLQGAGRWWRRSPRRRRRAKVTRRIWRAELEQMAQASDKEAGIRKATVELEWQITVEELKVRRCLTEPKGQGTSGGVESRGDGWTTTDQGGAGGTREPVN